jgi:predicted amidohydrolase YtcJ
MSRSSWLVATLLAAGSAAGAAEKADRVFINGNVWTGEPKQPRAQALAVRGPAILAVGTNDQVRKHTERLTQVIDLKGRLVVPGFNDAHLHFLSGSLSLSVVSLEGAATLQEVQRRIGAFAKANREASWVVGRGWAYGAFPGGLPDRRDLDAVVSDRPALMTAYDGHTAWCNSAALHAAGVTRATPDPEGGVIARDADGEPTGVLKEAAQRLVRDKVPPASKEEKLRALKRGLELAASYGLTSAQNAMFDLADLPVYEQLLREGGLKLRFYSALPLAKDTSADDLAGYRRLRDTQRSPYLRFGAVKGVVDGVVESKTAAMLEPYVGGGSGLPTWSPEELNQAVARCDREGLQVLLHAIGDRGIRMALDAFAHAAQANGPSSRRRHRVEHVEVPDPADVPRFKALGVIAATQAYFASPDANTLGVYAGNLGPVRAARAMPFKLLDDAGAVQAFGSDWPVYSCEVLKGMYAAVARKTPEGAPERGWYPEHRITVEAALRHFTRDAAYASFEESVKGTLVPGKAADFVVLSEDVLSGPPERLLTARVLLTVMAGNDTHRSRDF